MSLISPELLAILVCPEDRTPLRLADDGLVAALNRGIGVRRVKNRAGEVLEKTLDGGLVRDDASAVYPIVDGIPVLLVDEAIPLDQLPPADRPR
jgi:uncharacterized protein YbaR (Trm112 family)